MSHNQWDDYDYHMHTGELSEYFDNNNDSVDNDKYTYTPYRNYRAGSHQYKNTLKENPKESDDTNTPSLFFITSILIILYIVFMIFFLCLGNL